MNNEKNVALVIKKETLETMLLRLVAVHAVASRAMLNLNEYNGPAAANDLYTVLRDLFRIAEDLRELMSDAPDIGEEVSKQ